MFNPQQIHQAIQQKHHDLDSFKILISPEAQDFLEAMAQKSQNLTRRRFGNNISLYVPLYISNYCINECQYCGYNLTNKFKRLKLSMQEIAIEAETLKKQGFEHILLLTGEAPSKAGIDYLEQAVKTVKKIVHQVSIEIYPLSQADYERLIAAGCDGITIYQETYNRDIYREVHKNGPKQNYDYRYDTPIRAAKAGIRSVGLGFLMGLSPWREEILAMVKHARQVLQANWRIRIGFSFPRLRPHLGSFTPKYPVNDLELAQMVFALRLFFPDAELVLSTREPARIRDGLLPLGITRISAGSSTQPGGYKINKDQVSQFDVDDKRTPAEISKLIKSVGMEPLWKDWDWAFNIEEDFS